MPRVDLKVDACSPAEPSNSGRTSRLHGDTERSRVLTVPRALRAGLSGTFSGGRSWRHPSLTLS